MRELNGLPHPPNFVSLHGAERRNNPLDQRTLVEGIVRFARNDGCVKKTRAKTPGRHEVGRGRPPLFQLPAFLADPAPQRDKAAAIADTSGFMKKLPCGMIAAARPCRCNSPATTGPIAAIGVMPNAA